MLQTHGDEHIWLRIVILDPSGFTVLRGILASLYSTGIAAYSDRWLPSVTSGDPTSKLFDPALCFSLRRPVQVVFFRLNYHHFFFFRLNYHPDFYSSLKSLYVHQVIGNHLTELKNFIDLFTCLSVHLHTFITYLHLSLSILYAIYINLYLFFHVSTHLYSLCS